MVLLPRPIWRSSRLTLFLLETKGIRHFARPLIHSFAATLPDGSRILMDGQNYQDQKFIVNEVYGLDVYEKQHRLSIGDVVIDAGANIGIFSLKAAREIGPSGTLLAVEPATKTFAKLKTNVSNNHFQNIRLFQCAAGPTNGEATLYLERHDGHSSLYTRPGRDRNSERVPVRPLDDILESSGLKRCDFLKIDTEGAELGVLEGAERILSDFRPYLSMETHKFGAKTQDILDFLEKRGYAVEHDLGADGSGYLFAQP